MLVITRCASPNCRAPIFWAITRGKKKPMPIDAEPIVDGNLRLLTHTTPIIVTSADQLELGEVDDGVRYQAHFVTCPDADKWRGGRARAGDTPGPDYRKPRVR